MKKNTTTLLTILGLSTMPTWVSAAPLVSTALGNGGEIYEVRAGTYGELFPEDTNGTADRSVLALDVTLPGEATRRLVVPPTVGSETELSPKLLYSKESGAVNVVWTSLAGGEVSVHLTRFDGSDWSAGTDEIYFNPDGVVPLMALTEDELHLDLEGGASVDAERQVLHLVWPRVVDGQSMLAYVPAIVLNGDFLGVGETFDLPHLNPASDGPGHPEMAPTFFVSVADEDLDRVTLTFGSSESRRVTSYDVEVVPMEIVHFAELIREHILDSEDFDPTDVVGYADTLGTYLIDIGNRRNLRSRVLLTPSVLNYVASGTARWIRDNGATYDAGQLAELAADAGSEALRLATSLFSSGTPVGESSGVKSLRTSDSDTSALVIDVSGLLDGSESPIPSNLLELSFAVEVALPDSQGSEITLFTSDDGRKFLASWLDPGDPSVLWYVESGFGGSWQPYRKLQLGESLSLEQAHALLQQRIR